VVGQARTIILTWEGENKPGELELVRLFHKKPELFLALAKCADSVLTVDAELMAYVMGNPRSTQEAQDAVNPLVRSGLGNSESEVPGPSGSSTS